MPRFAAFLRGMNVGGHRASGAELCACFKAAGLEDVAAFRASGNVVFTSTGRAGEATLTKRIEAALEDTLGYAVPTYLRSGHEVGAIAAHDPFPPRMVAASKGKLQVMLLRAAPTAAQRRDTLAHATDDDRLAFEGRELYWLPKGGMSDSELDLKAIGRILGAATVRTKGTVEQIVAKHFATDR